MDPDDGKTITAEAGARMGHKVTIHKLEKTTPDGKKIPTHPRYRWRCAFVANGKRASKYFRARKEAEEWAANREKEARVHGTESTLTAAERSAIQDTRGDLQDLGLSVREALTFAIEYHRRARNSCTVAQLAEKAVASRVRSGLSYRHTRDMKGKLQRFVSVFGNRSVATLTHGEIEQWLHGLKLTPASFNSYRRILVVALNDAKRDGHLTENPAEKVRPSKVIESEVGILTPTEAAAMLAGADPEILPALAVGLFAGLRMAEIERMSWSEIHLEFGNVQVKASKAKSAKNRMVPIPENLAAWLRQSPRKTGSLWPPSHQRGRKLMEAAHRAAGFGTAGEVRKNLAKAKKLRESGDTVGADKVPVLREWPDNALRHSYATYHLAFHENAGALALHLGHTNTNLIFAHYRRPVTKEEAALYWTLGPENAAEVAKGPKATGIPSAIRRDG